MSYLAPLFQNESSCKTFHIKMSLICVKPNEPVGGTHFHINGFAQRLVLIQRQKVTRKWPVLTGKFLFFRFRKSAKCSK